MQPPERPGPHHRPRARSAQPSHPLFGEPPHVVDELVEVAAELAIEHRWRRDVEPQPRGAVVPEVHRRTIDLDVADLPQPKVDHLLRHVLRTLNQTRGHRVEVLVDEVARLRGRVHQPHHVRRTIVEYLVRRVVALLAQKGVQAQLKSR